MASPVGVNIDSNILCDSKSKITSYFKKKLDDSFPAVLARMTARDGIPFIKFCTSEDLRILLSEKVIRTYRNLKPQF